MHQKKAKLLGAAKKSGRQKKMHARMPDFVGLTKRKRPAACYAGGGTKSNLQRRKQLHDRNPIGFFKRKKTGKQSFKVAGLDQSESGREKLRKGWVISKERGKNRLKEGGNGVGKGNVIEPGSILLYSRENASNLKCERKRRAWISVKGRCSGTC